MSADLPSSNPFRRKAPAVSFPASNDTSTTHRPDLPQLDTGNVEVLPPVTVRTKPVKKVRVQSPPASPETSPFMYSPPPRNIADRFPDISADPFPGTQREAASNDELSASLPASSSVVGVPPNPFSKTLATLERTDEYKEVEADDVNRAGPSAGRAAMDVDAFKRMLMTGKTESSPRGSADASAGLPVHIGFAMNEGGSNTDVSSISKQSVFESIQDAHPESPRTSHEISDTDDERRRLRADSAGSASGRKKPPPPSSRHGKLIKMELKGEDSGSLGGGQTITPPQRSPIDVHKPLPAAPTRASHESDREDIFDKESLGKVPEPPSPTQAPRKGPPPPPSRRHSQLVADSKLSVVSGRLSPNLEEDDVPSASWQSVTSPPPPPPSRRPASIRHSSYIQGPGSPLATPASFLEGDRPSSASGKTVPMPPPSRHTSIRQSARPPSISSVDMSTSGRRSGATPPPPPPPRARASSRNSMDLSVRSPGSGRTSGEYFRRSIDSGRRPSTDSARGAVGVGSFRKGSGSSAQHEVIESSAVGGTTEEEIERVHSRNALADIEALQREIDALRLQSAAATRQAP